MPPIHMINRNYTSINQNTVSEIPNIIKSIHHEMKRIVFLIVLG